MNCAVNYDSIIVSHSNILNHRQYSGIHFHNVYEIYYLLDGSTNYFIGDEIFHITPGAFVFIPKEVLHKTDSETCLINERFLVNIDDNLLDDAIKHILYDLCRQRVVYVLKGDFPLFEELIHRIEREYNGNSPYRSEMLRLYISELLIKVKRKKSIYKPVFSETEKMIQKVSEYISENYSTDLKLNILAEKFAISESYLSRKFKELCGIGLNEYITYVRITNAEKILKNGKMKITEVAMNCGFNDSNYFSTIFKKLKGVTPFKYSKTFGSEKN